MSQHATSIYKGALRSGVKTPELKPRNLTPKQILYLRYQCAMENKDFKMAESLKALMTSSDEKTDPSEARQKAEQLFRRDHHER